MQVDTLTTEQLEGAKKGLLALVHDMFNYQFGIEGKPHKDIDEVYTHFADVDRELAKRTQA